MLEWGELWEGASQELLERSSGRRPEPAGDASGKMTFPLPSPRIQTQESDILAQLLALSKRVGEKADTLVVFRGAGGYKSPKIGKGGVLDKDP